jgi:hypothetical protein
MDMDNDGPTPPQNPNGQPPRHWHWPEAASKPGALFYAIAGGLIVWLVVDFLPHHVHIIIR